MLSTSLLEQTCTKIISHCNKLHLKHGICIHTPIIKLGLHHNLLLSNNLLSLYTKCQSLQISRQLFDEMPHRDIVSWTAILSAYVNNNSHNEALRVYNSMKLSGENPNEFTFSSLLRSCTSVGDFVSGRKVQACVVKHGYESNAILCSGLIEMYSKWGLLEEAVRVFCDVENGDTGAWTSVISALVEGGKPVEALRFFVNMMGEGVWPNEYTFVKVLKGCGSLLEIGYGKIVHAILIVSGVRMNVVVKTSLVDMYGKCRRMEDALKVLKETGEQDVKLWTSLITGFNRNLNFVEGIRLFREMVGNFVVPNGYSYAGVISACSSIRGLELGRQVHLKVVTDGLENDVSVGNALIDFYAKCSNDVENVIRVFKGITQPNVISWTTLISGLAAKGLEDECFQAFHEMRFVGHRPNSFTLYNMLQATKSVDGARKIHGLIIKTNADNDIIVGNALISAYAELHNVDCALSLAKGARNKSIITYTVLVSKLNQIGLHKRTLDVIKQMMADDVKMDGLIIPGFLSASANLGALQTGKQLHCYSIVSGFANWISVSNGLIDLYGKCRYTHDALKAFREISSPDIISWNGLMHGYIVNGCITSALSTLEDMRLAGAKPDSITLSMVLLACGQGGLVDMGVEYFHSLSDLYDIKVEMNHYNLLVDLLGRAGRLDEATGVIQSMPYSADASIYKKMLLACKLHGNILLGEEMARRGLKLEPNDVEFRVILASMYDEAGRPELGNSVRGFA